MVNPQEKYFDEEGNPVGRETVSGRFATVDSLEAQAHEEHDSSRKRAANEAMYEAAANEAQYIEAEAAEQRIRALQERSLQKRSLMQERASAKKVALRGVRGLSAFARWSGLGVAAIAYAFQFLFASVSLIGLALQATAHYVLNDTTLGKVAATVAKWVGFDLEKLFPAEYLTMGFWALATFVGLCTFFGFWIWFYLTGVRVLRTTSSTLMTSLVFASLILPVSNLFPGIIVWVIYINSLEMVSLFSGHEEAANDS